MNTPVGYLKKRRQTKLAMWTEGARIYLQFKLAHPTRRQPSAQPMLDLQTIMDNWRHSSGFGKTVRHSLRQSFTGQLMNFMRKRNRTALLVCRAAGIPRSLLAEILSDQHYQPTRELALLLTVALHLHVHEADKLLSHAGYALSHQSPRDIVIEYFLRLHVYHLGHINEVLRRLELPALTYEEDTVCRKTEQPH